MATSSITSGRQSLNRVLIDISPNDVFDLNTLPAESSKSHAEIVYDDKNNQIPDMMQPSVVEDTRPNWLPFTWVYYTVTRSNRDSKTFGRVDKYYISPEEKMYRSEKSVKEYLGMPYNSRKSVKKHVKGKNIDQLQQK